MVHHMCPGMKSCEGMKCLLCVKEGWHSPVVRVLDEEGHRRSFPLLKRNGEWSSLKVEDRSEIINQFLRVSSFFFSL